MNNITEQFGRLYFPQAAIILYQSKNVGDKVYVEAYGMDGNGCAVNGHPLTIAEAGQLATVLDSAGDLNSNFLKSKGLMPDNVLHLSAGSNAYLLWHTPAAHRHLSFTSSMGLTDTVYPVPPMLWKAGKNALQVFALKQDCKPKMKTVIYHAPFFNIYDDGKVCMGTTKTRIPPEAGMEEFMRTWEHFFWASSFSHLLRNTSPVKGNIIDCFLNLQDKTEAFPVDILRKHPFTLQNLIR
ncbi:PRTRC system protein B [Taibaiella koreensis]|uniref:PRTRC system protein B n=1 Tax=Taibaiella koreensis TaxID=1268548 RepID=UPI000E59CF4D|nr:PRTRC system protein B [Taibaiella koreensis]